MSWVANLQMSPPQGASPHLVACQVEPVRSAAQAAPTNSITHGQLTVGACLGGH